MTYITSNRPLVRLHLTNVVGAGATELLQSLLPALESNSEIFVERIELPDRGKLASYRSRDARTATQIYRRRLPNALSRVLECTLLAGRFDGDSPLLVLGDLPLRCRGPQTVFVQTSHLVKTGHLKVSMNAIKQWISRVVFRICMNRVHTFIVQTEVMRDELERSYPTIAGRVSVIAQPVPSWLLHSGLRRRERFNASQDGLNLIYPAVGYPHKNHELLSRLSPKVKWPIKRLIITLDPVANPASHLPWVYCSGFLSSEDMIAAYSKADALLFLSKEESYGFPLIEAMFVGLPIVCPDLPYAHILCGDQAIYFDPDSPESLLAAFHALRDRLEQGWWPCWDDRLKNIPNDWSAVAKQIIEVLRRD